MRTRSNARRMVVLLAGVAGLSACAHRTRGTVSLSAPTPLSEEELFFCAISVAHDLDYTVERADRASGVLVAKGRRYIGHDAQGDRVFDELRVSLIHETAGDILHVIATDRGHGETVLRRCARP